MKAGKQIEARADRGFLGAGLRSSGYKLFIEQKGLTATALLHRRLHILALEAQARLRP